MALVKAVVIGAAAAIGLPWLVRDQRDFGGIFDVWVLRPVPGNLEIHFSIPVFLIITLFAWAIFVWTEK